MYSKVSSEAALVVAGMIPSTTGRAAGRRRSEKGENEDAGGMADEVARSGGTDGMDEGHCSGYSKVGR